MQRPNDKKRATIAAAAARLFATRPFHEVRLEDVAAAAGVGKGTLYVYFSSKEDLYFALIHDGFAALVDRLQQQLESDEGPAMRAIRSIVQGLVDFSLQNPHLFFLMRSMGMVKCTAKLDARRTELASLI
jgi:AcrR family transcriptional regulator